MKGFLLAGLTAVLLAGMSSVSQANWGYGHHHCGNGGYGYAYPYGGGYARPYGYYGAAYRPYYSPGVSVGVGGVNAYYGGMPYGGVPYGVPYGGAYRPYGW